MTRSILPTALLAAYATAFGWRALGGGLLVFDDHPGQLYRVAHAITIGMAPWRFDPGWWAGYAELQYYPPGAAWLGALLHHATLGALSAEAVYQVLLWVAWLLPGAATYVLLRRVLADRWLALPGALVALTLSAGCRSGVEEGLHWGLVAARLGWGALPLLAWGLLGWAEGGARPPWPAAALVAAVTLLHPAHAPTAAVMVLLAAAQVVPRPRRLARAAAMIVLGFGLAAVWLLPLLAHLGMALPLAWRGGSLAGRIALQPVMIALALLTVVAWRLPSPVAPSRGAWLLGLAPAMAVVVAVDALVAEPLGLAWLPADRVMDGLYWALVVGGSLGFAALATRLARPALGVLGAVVLCVPLSWGPGEAGLSLWPIAAEWPKDREVVRGLRLDALWSALAAAPAGRVLFVRSGVALDWRPEWWRPHSHVTALTPLRAGRAIVGGTFTHPSPVAGLVYTGSAANRPLTLLAEQRDGVTLFGRPLEALDPEAFNRLADRLAISTVVAPDEDAGRAAFLAQNPRIRRQARIGAFNIFVFAEPRSMPVAVGDQRWRVDLGAGSAGWRPLPVAYSPLWVARAGDVRLPLRRDETGLLEVDAPAGLSSVELEHRPAVAEWLGIAVSLLSLAALGVVSLGRTRA